MEQNKSKDKKRKPTVNRAEQWERLYELIKRKLQQMK